MFSVICVPDVLDDSICEPLPAFVLVRIGLTLTDCEAGVQQQNSLKIKMTIFVYILLIICVKFDNSVLSNRMFKRALIKIERETNISHQHSIDMHY